MGYDCDHYYFVNGHGIGKFYLNLNESESDEFWIKLQKSIPQSGFTKLITFGNIAYEFNQDEFCSYFKNVIIPYFKRCGVEMWVRRGYSDDWINENLIPIINQGD